MVKPSAETDDAIRTAHVLELDPDLGADLDPQRLVSARADLMTPLAELEWTSHEGRSLVQFWQLAERWGHVDRDGIAVSLPLTHELLAKLVGAARPSVTTALGRLAERELLQRTGDVWRLSGDSRGVVMSAF